MEAVVEDADEEEATGWPVAGAAADPDVVAVDAVDVEAAAVPCVCRTCRRGAGLFGFGGSAVALRAATPEVVAAVAVVELVAALAAGFAVPFLFGAGRFGFGGSMTEVVDADVVGPAVALPGWAATPLRLGAGLVGIGGSATSLGPAASGDGEREVGGVFGARADVEAVLELAAEEDVGAGGLGVSW